MNAYPAWKNLLVALFVTLAALYALPNIFGSDLAVQISAEDNAPLGENMRARSERILKDADIDYRSVEIENQQILVRLPDSESQLAAKDALRKSLTRNFVVALNLAPAIPDWLTALGGQAMALGLDLRGGVHFLMEVDMDAVAKTEMMRYDNELRTLLRKDRLYRTVAIEGKMLVVRFRDLAGKTEGMRRIRDDFPELEIREIAGADTNLLHLGIREEAEKEAKKNALKQNITTLRNRVNELGVAEPIIQQQGTDRIIVQLPGVQDTARAKEILGAVATLEFRLVDEKGDPRRAAASGHIPANLGLYYFRDGTPLLLKNEIIATGENITSAASGVDQQSNSPLVNISLDNIGGKAMLETTKKYLHHRMAVVFIENKVETIIKNGEPTKKRTTTKDIINAATIQGIFSNRFQITGLDSVREARNLALLLRAGSLSAPIEIIEERTIGPSLGADNIRKGFISVVIGFVLVFVFMVWRYRVFGMVANIALMVNLVMIVALLSLLQATLTLPGIVGIVLTVGMAVDANVLIFERIKEEIALGSSIQKAIDGGYHKALLTISDASITTLIAAVVLFSFGTGPIKGFAVTLSLGILTSMFTAIIGSRAIINKIYGGRKITALAI